MKVLLDALLALHREAESYVNLSRVQGECLRPEAADAVRNAMAGARQAVSKAESEGSRAKSPHDYMLQALREVEGDHIQLEWRSDSPSCAFCASDEGTPHEPECTMNIVLAALDVAEGRVAQAIYTVGAPRDPESDARAKRQQFVANAGDPRR